jgi:hypothetical protein
VVVSALIDARGAAAPSLANLIAAWRLSPGSRLCGRQPAADDLVVPTRSLTPIDASDAVHAFRDGLHELALRVELLLDDPEGPSPSGERPDALR